MEIREYPKMVYKKGLNANGEQVNRIVRSKAEHAQATKENFFDTPACSGSRKRGTTPQKAVEAVDPITIIDDDDEDEDPAPTPGS